MALPAGAQTTSGWITGSVTADATGLAVADVCIEAQQPGTGEPVVFHAVTDALGRYEMAVPAAEYIVSFRPCTTSQYSYEPEFWNNSRTDGTPVQVEAGQTVSGIDAALAADGTAFISGRVDHVSGEPLNDVCVQTYHSSNFEGAELAMVRADGTYDVFGLEPGTYVVEFRGCGYPYFQYRPEYWAGSGVDGTIYRELATTITLTEHEGRRGIDADIRPPGTSSLSGEVTADETGEPVPWICVEVYDVDEPRYPVTKVVIGEAGGAWTVERLDAGTYVVGFYGCGRAPQQPAEWWAEKATFAEADRILLAEGEYRGSVDERMPLNAGDKAGIVGRVVDAGTDQPLEGICVKAHRLSRPQDPPPGGLTDVDGMYRIDGLYAEAYAVSFNDCGFSDPALPPEYWHDRPFLEAATPVELKAGQTVIGIDAALGSTACPNGEVPPADYEDVPDDNVHGFSIDCMTWHGVATGTDGRDFVPEGSVTRAQMAGFVTRALDNAGVTLAASPPDAFSDDDDSYFEHQINQLAALGIVRGTTSGEYLPRGLVTRAAMATYLVNAYEVAASREATSAGDRFVDDTGRAHEESINLAAATGLVQGSGDGRYNPDAATRRDQMTSMLSRLIDKATPRF